MALFILAVPVRLTTISAYPAFPVDVRQMRRQPLCLHQRRIDSMNTHRSHLPNRFPGQLTWITRDSPDQNDFPQNNHRWDTSNYKTVF